MQTATQSLREGLSWAQHRELIFDRFRKGEILECEMDVLLSLMPTPDQWNSSQRFAGTIGLVRTYRGGVAIGYVQPAVISDENSNVIHTISGGVGEWTGDVDTIEIAEAVIKYRLDRLGRDGFAKGEWEPIVEWLAEEMAKHHLKSKTHIKQTMVKFGFDSRLIKSVGMMLRVIAHADRLREEAKQAAISPARRRAMAAHVAREGREPWHN